MQEAQPLPTQQKVDEVEQKVKELEYEVEKVKQANATTPPLVEKAQLEAEDLTTNPAKSPRKILIIILIIGLALLLLGVLAYFLTSGIFFWLLVPMILVIVLMSDRVS